MTDDVFFAPIPDLNAWLKKREFSAVDLAKAFGARLETLGPKYNALALPLTKVAVDRAKDVDKELRIERYRGPLQGVPFGAINLLSLAGHPTVWGPDETATVLSKLDDTGSPLIARLSGPDAAVAAGLVPYALGSETSGDRGVTALRPTYGLVSRHGARPLSWTLDTIGAVCRTAEDCGLVLAAIAGGDSDDPGSAGKSFYFAPRFARKLSDTKIGFAAVDNESAGPEIRPALDAARKTLADTGANLVEVKLPDFPWDAILGTVIGAEEASLFEPLVLSGKAGEWADPDRIERIRANLAIPATQYLKAMRARTLIQRSFRELFENVDILVAPARYSVAPKIDQTPDTQPNLIPASNLAGLPAIAFPCGFANGLPVGLQLVGPAFRENALLAVAIEFQKRTDWHKRRPPS
jgi:aspartyl-tRNA(Asn)/glutamyl-tRNA(Gln) amidotransferase subunit A